MPTNTTVVRTLYTTLLGASLATALLHSIGCTPSSGSAFPATAARPADPAATVDAGFVQAAERSSDFAVRMSDLQITNGARDDIKAAAQAIRSREAANLTLLAKERARLGLPAISSGHTDDPHLAFDTDKLATMTGEAADTFYVEHMIEQRRSMIDATILTQRELPIGALAVFARGLTGELGRDIVELKGVQHAAQVMPTNSRGNKGTKGGLRATKVKK